MILLAYMLSYRKAIKTPPRQHKQHPKPNKHVPENPMPKNLPFINQDGVKHTQASLRKMQSNLRDRLMERTQQQAKSRWIGATEFDENLDDDDGWVAI